MPANVGTKQRTGSQAKDVVHRQCADENHAFVFVGFELLATPSIDLQDIGENVAMGEHGAFGDTRRAAGVL